MMSNNFQFSNFEFPETLLVKRQVKYQQILPRIASFISFKQNSRAPRKIQIYFRTSLEPDYMKTIEKLNSTKNEDPTKKKNGLRKRKSSCDDEYNVKSQKKDRNVISNIIHHLFKYLTISPEIDSFVAKLIEFNNLSITFNEFKYMMKTDSDNLRTYVTMKHIKQLWFSPLLQKQEYCKIMRIVSNYFFMSHGFISIYASNKFNTASKKTHYQGLRSMIRLLSMKKIDYQE